MKKVFEQIVQNFTKHFEDCHDKAFTTQNVRSCLDIYNACKEANPDHVVEMGTNHGASTLSICLAMNGLGKPLSNITTMDLSHVAWLEAPKIQGGIPEIAAMDLSLVKYVTGDFKNIDPLPVKSAGKLFVFYDIHDHTFPLSQKFLDEWLPYIRDGVIAIHDISEVPSNYVLPESDTKRSKAVYKDKMYAGFAECETFVNWAVANNVTLNSFHGGISFKVAEGKLL